MCDPMMPEIQAHEMAPPIDKALNTAAVFNLLEKIQLQSCVILLTNEWRRTAIFRDCNYRTIRVIRQYRRGDRPKFRPRRNPMLQVDRKKFRYQNWNTGHK